MSSAVTKPSVVDPFANTVAPGPSDLFAPPSYMDSGFPAPGGDPVKPPLGFFNWLFNYATNGIRYLSAFGIPTWDAAETEYAVGSTIRSTDGFIYELVGTATTGTAPHLDLANWFRKANNPRALIGQYATEVQKFLNAKRQAGSFVNHQGIVDGELLEWDENWPYALTTPLAGPAATRFANWNYLLRAAAGATIATPGCGVNLATIPWGPLVSLATHGSGGAGTACLELATPLLYMSGTSVSLSFNFSLNGASAPDPSTRFAIGLSDGTLAANTSDAAFNNVGGGGPAPVGVAVYGSVGSSSVPIIPYARAPGGAVVTGTALVAALNRDSPQRIRIEILGTGADDNSAAKVVFYCNGALIATLNVDMGTALLYPFIRVATGNSTVETCTLNVGRLRLKARLATGDTTV
jgi:hypothetical protein